PVAGGRRRAEPDVLERLGKFLRQEVEHLLRVVAPRGPLDAGVDVLGVLAEDHHVDLLGMLDRRRHALEPAHRPQADVQIQQLTKRDVERPDAAADRRRQRTLDANVVLPERLDRLIRKPRVELLEALLAGVDFLPCDLPRAAERFLDRGVQDTDARPPDIRTGAVAFDERDDRIVRHDEMSLAARDGCAHKFFRSGHLPFAERFPQTLWKTLWKTSRVYIPVTCVPSVLAVCTTSGRFRRRPKPSDYTYRSIGESTDVLFIERRTRHAGADRCSSDRGRGVRRPAPTSA